MDFLPGELTTLKPNGEMKLQNIIQEKALRRRCVQLFVLVFVIIGVGCGAQRTILFPTDHVKVADTIPNFSNSESMKVEFPEGSVDFLLLKSLASEGEKSGVVFYAHGNASSIDQSAWSLSQYRLDGYHVALVEYRGYGRSTGSPSQARITEDFAKAYDLVVARPDVDSSKIVYHGRSLGGAVLCSLARHRPPAAMILESTFTSLADVANSFFPGASIFVKDHFRSREALSKLPDLPLLVFHGTEDEIVPVSQGRELSESVPGSKLVLFKSGHNNLPRYERYWSEIQSFLQTL